MVWTAIVQSALPLLVWAFAPLSPPRSSIHPRIRFREFRNLPSIAVKPALSRCVAAGPSWNPRRGSRRGQGLSIQESLMPSACASFCSRSIAASAITVPGG